MSQLLNLFTRRRQERSGCSPVFLIAGSVIAFIAATAILWSNEGRVDFGRIGAESVAIEASAIDPSHDGLFVAASGLLVGDAPIGDRDFLQPGDWLEVERLVEMYAWEQKSEGSDENSSSYSYHTAWTDDPADSSAFSVPGGHANPPLTVSGGVFRPESGRLGRYGIDTRGLDLPAGEPLVLDKEGMIAGSDRSLSSEYIFVGKGTLAEPAVGDLRIHFQAVPSGRQAVLFGQVAGDSIVPYFHRERDRLYRAFFSGRADALAEMSAEYRFALWGMRVAGLVLYWVSFLLVFSPFIRLLGGIPLLGRLGKGLIAIVTFVVAALLALVVATLAYLFHNPLALLILLLLAGLLFAVGRAVWQRKQPKAGQ
ncbi:MAG: TMEM43 family protein [Caldilineaceae bacterium]